MRLISAFAVLVAAFSAFTQARVSVQVGHWLQPLLNRTSDVIILENRDIVFQLKCLAPYPTEWVYNDDDQHPNARRRLRIEWSDRKFQRSIDESVYDYIAWIQLQYTRVMEKEVLVCRAVADHADRIRVSVQPNNNAEVQITEITMSEHGGGGTEMAEDFAVPETVVRTGPQGDAPDCDGSLSVISTTNGIYWSCELNDGQERGQVAFHACRPSAAHCANTFRIIKQLGKCVTVVNASEPQIPVEEIERTWTRMPADRARIPGVAVCGPRPAVYPVAAGRVESRRAVEYYFTEPSGHGDAGLSEIHFSWPPTPHHPEDLIRIQPSPSVMKSVYYTDESLHITCVVPKYGFAFDPVFTVSRNGSRVLLERDFSEDYLSSVVWTKELMIQFAHYGPGVYELSCIAPIWNTTEWAIQTRTVNVLEAKHIGRGLEEGQEQIISRLATIGDNIQKMGVGAGEHSRSVQVLLERMIVLQQRQLAITEQILASRGSVGPAARPAAVSTSATGPIPVSEIRNQLQSGKIASP